jgi:acyl carrier protein
VHEDIRTLFATLLRVPVDSVTRTTRPQELARWDSLQHMILVSGFEEEFALDIEPGEAVEMFRDFGTFESVILRKLNGAG